jgi:hypothetical protein
MGTPDCFRSLQYSYIILLVTVGSEAKAFGTEIIGSNPP